MQLQFEQPVVVDDGDGRPVERFGHGAGQIVGIISETIQKWDGQEAADKIELMVGKDLQYIRVNGTIVGALAGLVIYAVSQLLFF